MQPPAPSRPIERGIAGPGLLAHILVSKFADHQPLYRQSNSAECIISAGNLKGRNIKMTNKIIDDDVWVVIPAYNEGSKLIEVAAAVTSRFQNAVIVNDGSTDRTSQILAEISEVSSVSHPINLGQGAALQTGISYALRRGAKWIITLDADGQHDPDDAVVILTKAKEAALDICFGSRFLGATVGMTLSRKILLKCALLFQTVSTGMRMTDVHNGLRVISGVAASRINIRQNKMAHASEFISLCKALRFRYDEFPVTIRYTDYSRNKGQSSLGAIAILADLLLAKLGK